MMLALYSKNERSNDAYNLLDEMIATKVSDIHQVIGQMIKGHWGVDTERQTYLESENLAVTVSSTQYRQQDKGGDKHDLCLTSSGLQKVSEF